jgi:hypothetical protein
MKEIEAMFPRLAVLDMMDDTYNIREYIDVSLIKLLTKFYAEYDNHLMGAGNINNIPSTNSSMSTMLMTLMILSTVPSDDIRETRRTFLLLDYLRVPV